jgi:translation initiation factor 4E
LETEADAAEPAAAAPAPASPADIGKHRLPAAFNFWYLNRKAAAGYPAEKDVYETGMHKAGPFATVEDFWLHYCHARRPTEPAQAYIAHHCFRDGVDPFWEHPANARGGRWIVRLRKGAAARAWECALLALVGDEYNLGDELCGVVLAKKRHGDDALSFWVRASSKDATAHVRDAIKRLLGVGSNALEYRMHDTSLQRHEATVAATTAGKERAASAAAAAANAATDVGAEGGEGDVAAGGSLLLGMLRQSGSAGAAPEEADDDDDDDDD